MSSAPTPLTRRARYSLLSPWPRDALQFINALERAGLLRYVSRGGDRRLRLASLTPDGARSLERVESTMRRLLLTNFRRLTR